MSTWKTLGEGPTWCPILTEAESMHGIPEDLLCRVAYQESRFRQDIIDGTTVSDAGALGLMQLEPKYFASARAAKPFTPDDTRAQIEEAATFLTGLYNHFQDWGLALAAYNWGRTDVNKYVAGVIVVLPRETSNYVSEILADVPLPTSIRT